MFCSEMDGIDSLNDVVIILASNRADLIDPAILRPGRIDRKIKVNRPDKEGTREIYRIYLTDSLPYDGVLAKEADGIGASIERLVERFVDWQFARRDENKFLEVTLRSGRKETLYRSDLISGEASRAHMRLCGRTPSQDPLRVRCARTSSRVGVSLSSLCAAHLLGIC